MNALPPALQGLAAFNQWLNYRLTPLPKGKTRKEAIGRDGYRVDPTNPTKWMSFDEAASTGLPLAFSFSESDPFFFLDIDNALQPNGEWSPVARGVLDRLRGCAVEISSSGKGLHIFGVGCCESHRNRRDDLGLEFYTQGRFVALTGNLLTPDGSVFNAPPGLQSLVAEYFPPHEATVDADWTDGPVADWAGPTEDLELVRRASRHVSASAVFGGRASFSDLWNCNIDVLASAFPSSTGPYDASSADAALCAHLAFWTGKDCERMVRLLRVSGLARDKHEREDYVQRTVLNACRLSSDVLREKPAATMPVPVPPPPSAAIGVATAREAKPEIVESVGFLRPEQAQQLFAGCVYIRDLDRVWMPNGEMLKPSAFNVFFGGYQFLMDDVGKKTTDEAFKALTRNPLLRAPQVAAATFDPKMDPGAIVEDFKGREAVNTWLPPIVRVVDGDPGPFLRHLQKVLPVERDRQILLSWMAALVQFPGHKFTWAPVLQGVEGNGKSFFAMCCSSAVSALYSHTPRNKDLMKDFNSWMHRKLFAVVDEARVDTPEMIESLRNLITEETQTIEPKGVDAESHKVFVNFMFTMNDKRAMKKTRNDRRLAMFYTAQQCESDIARDGMDGDYMQNLYDWAKGQHTFKHMGEGYGFGIITHYLKNFPIPHDLNPIGAAHRAPRTSAHEEAVSSSLGAREQEVQEAIDSGVIGFRGHWVSSHFALETLRKRDPRVRVSNLDEVMANLKYVRHPNLKDGRTNNLVQPDGGRSVLYVDSRQMDLLALAGGEAAKAYTLAQSIID